ncbi:NUDIX hydrolase [Phenylobacterium sp.]|uniref:NUDIX domain-containing protein n=1 Tax=Phenylobacterium sp. TaxID=1871053 RepID=UPI002730DD67|nr:NUDIX hydrolase [Phenylobacterium sp.]MDP1875899.1 NUDIX hydrolase [Phenylobacterium sp.]MDP3299959.1 NUDIX hydrolase [Phenylobacterium sp.]
MSQKPIWRQSHGRPWGAGPPRRVFDNAWIALEEYDAVAPTGAKARYGVVRFKNLALAILPLHEDGTVTLVGQNRFPHADYSWEIPEGGGPVNGDPLEHARRELREEVGLEAAEWREVLRAQLSNSVTDERAVGFLALGLSPVDQAPDDTEDLAVARVPFSEALETALAGHMPDMLTLAMLLRAYHMAKEGALPSALARRLLS